MRKPFKDLSLASFQLLQHLRRSQRDRVRIVESDTSLLALLTPTLFRNVLLLRRVLRPDVSRSALRHGGYLAEHPQGLDSQEDLQALRSRGFWGFGKRDLDGENLVDRERRDVVSVRGGRWFSCGGVRSGSGFSRRVTADCYGGGTRRWTELLHPSLYSGGKKGAFFFSNFNFNFLI